MRGVTRPLFILMLMQGVCLAAGLWIHDRFMISAAKWKIHAASHVSSAETPAATTGTPSVGGQNDSPASHVAEADVSRFLGAMPAAGILAFVWTIGLQSAIAYFLLSRVHGEHSRRQSKADEESLQHTRDLLRTRDAVIFGLAKLAESRDPETGQHLERISLYSTRLAAALSSEAKYRETVTPGFMRLIGISSALHDIGKVGIEDSVLLKPGEFTSTERERMQLHSHVGAACIREIERRLGRSNFLEMAREIAYSHHERWDGSGYPDGLAGEAIPLAARVVAIADVYDALSVRRAYKEPFPHRECVDIIRRESGKQFDPNLVRIFLEVESQFEEIARRFADESSSEASGPRPEPMNQGIHGFTPEQQQALLEALAHCEKPAQPLQPAGEKV